MVYFRAFALLVVLCGLCPDVCVAGTQCFQETYTYSDASECGQARPKNFHVKRCATSQAELASYLKGQSLDSNLNADECKQMWLKACANFYGSFVVVPKAISCRSVICDQSSFFSNCVSDDDCVGISSVKEGVAPDSNSTWPIANNQTGFRILADYFPCCDFWEMYCNGAKGPVNMDGFTPTQLAAKDGWCRFSGQGACWMPNPLSR